jgi:AraC-like DNA-binding protein
MATNRNDHAYLQTVPRPISAMATDYPAGYVGSVHSHPRAQLLYATSGCMKITFDTGYWIIPPQRAVWLPPGYPHRTGTIGPVQMRTLYIREDACSSDAPNVPRMVGVSALLRELILRATHMPVEYDEQGQDARIIGALLGEIDWTALHPISLPTLRDARLQKMEEMFIRTPNDRGTLDQWAERLEISPRTLTRLLQREVQLSFQVWRDQIRTFTALPLIAEGRPLTEVADAVGYGTAWSFTAMFKRVTGKVPSRYFSAEINA